MDRITHPDDWQALTDTAPLPQHWAYGLAMEAIGARVLRLVQDGRPVQALVRRGVRLIHRANPLLCLPPLARYPGLTLVSTTARSHRLLPVMTARHHALWDISGPPETLLAAMRPSWRQRLLQAKVRVRDRPQDMEELLARFDAQGRVRGYRHLPAAFARHWPGGRLVLSVGQPITAGAVFLMHGPEASYHAAWADAEGLRQGAPRAILWQAALRLAALGVQRIDLGNIDSGNPGLAHFKLHCGARPVCLGPTSLLLPL